jgi:hypothetical protein
MFDQMIANRLLAQELWTVYVQDAQQRRVYKSGLSFKQASAYLSRDDISCLPMGERWWYSIAPENQNTACK